MMINWMVIGGITAAMAVNVIAEECTFNGFNDGPLHQQQGWWVDRVGSANENFLIVDHLGITQTMGDKALVISGANDFMKIYRKSNAVTWKPTDTFTFELDFQFGLNGGHVDAAKNGIAMLIGDPTFNQENRWVISIGISPDGSWLIRGNAPHWENLKWLPPETFIARPVEGTSAVSSWFHLKLTSTKSQTPNVFKTNLLITDSDGNTVASHDFKEDPITGQKATLWDAETMNVAFSAKDDINGLVCIDNVRLTVEKGDRKVTGLQDLLNP